MQQINSNLLIPKLFDEDLEKKINYKFYKLDRENYSIIENFESFNDFIDIKKDIKRCNLSGRSINFKDTIKGACNLKYQKDGILREKNMIFIKI